MPSPIETLQAAEHIEVQQNLDSILIIGFEGQNIRAARFVGGLLLLVFAAWALNLSGLHSGVIFDSSLVPFAIIAVFFCGLMRLLRLPVWVQESSWLQISTSQLILGTGRRISLDEIWNVAYDPRPGGVLSPGLLITTQGETIRFPFPAKAPIRTSLIALIRSNILRRKLSLEAEGHDLLQQAGPPGTLNHFLQER